MKYEIVHFSDEELSKWLTKVISARAGRPFSMYLGTTPKHVHHEIFILGRRFDITFMFNFLNRMKSRNK